MKARASICLRAADATTGWLPSTKSSWRRPQSSLAPRQRNQSSTTISARRFLSLQNGGGLRKQLSFDGDIQGAQTISKLAGSERTNQPNGEIKNQRAETTPIDGANKLEQILEPAKKSQGRSKWVRSAKRKQPQRNGKQLRESTTASGEETGQHFLQQLIDLHEHYPNLPAELFTHPELYLEGRCFFSEPIMKTTRPLHGGAQYYCRYSVKVDQVRGVICSTDSDRCEDIAERVAAAKLILKLFGIGMDSGRSENFLNDGFSVLYNPKAELEAHDNTLTSVYNACASFLAVPKVKMRNVSGFKDGLFEVSIGLPEHGIHVEYKCKTLREAEAAASVHFKAAMDECQTVARNTRPSLQMHNALEFVEYAVGKAWTEHYRLCCYQLRGFPSNIDQPLQAFFELEGKVVGEPVVALSFQKGQMKYSAALTAAVSLAKADPDLIGRFMNSRKLESNNSSRHQRKAMRPIKLGLGFDWAHVGQTMAEAARAVSLSSDQQVSVGFEHNIDVIDSMNVYGMDEGSDDAETGLDLSSFDVRPENSRKPRSEFTLAPRNLKERSSILARRQNYFDRAPHLEELRKRKAKLPMSQFRSEVIELIEKNQYCIVLGATGSGKSTQVPQIVLEDGIAKGKGASINIICTQPRRIAAITVATRVAAERNEGLEDTVGYHVRYDKRTPVPGGSITYCTTGILLRQLQAGSDEVLDTTSHIVMDEVHERDLQNDFLLALLKQALETRLKANKRVPRLILMSATVDPELFAKYLEITDASGGKMPCPWLTVPGRTFPVKEMFLDDFKAQLDTSYSAAGLRLLANLETAKYLDSERRFAIAPQEASGVDGNLVPLHLMAATIAHVAKTTPDTGAILAFLPGLAEIKKLNSILLFDRPLGMNFADGSKFKLCLVHSELRDKQLEAFVSVPPGCRKIIIATNVAETSITIPDVQHVIDSGMCREKSYHHDTKMTSLTTVWISKSNSKQRAGRAGRVQNGSYYALFSRARYDSFKTVQLAQIHRADLQEICLEIKRQSFQIPIKEFLGAALEPPPPSAVDSAIAALQQLDALDKNQELTPLGRVLSTLPLHPALGKMVALGITFRCFDPLLILSAATPGRSLFDQKAAKRDESFGGFCFEPPGMDSQSDHIATINAFHNLRQIHAGRDSLAFFDAARAAGINVAEFMAMDRAMCAVEEALVVSGILPSTNPRTRLDHRLGPPALNENSDHTALIKALAVSCFPGHLSVVVSPMLSRTRTEDAVIISPNSVNAGRRDSKSSPKHTVGDLHLYGELARTNSGTILRETSEVSPLTVALFGSSLKWDGMDRFSKRERYFTRLLVDDWIPLMVPQIQQSKTIQEFRQALDKFLAISFRDLAKARGRKFDHVFAGDVVKKEFVDAVATVLDLDQRARAAQGQVAWRQDLIRLGDSFLSGELPKEVPRLPYGFFD